MEPVSIFLNAGRIVHKDCILSKYKYSLERPQCSFKELLHRKFVSLLFFICQSKHFLIYECFSYNIKNLANKMYRIT